MKSFKRTRTAVAAALLAALSITTVSATAIAVDAKGVVKAARGGDHWPN